MYRQCIAITRKKTQCTQKLCIFNILCKIHQKQYNKNPSPNINLMDILSTIGEVFGKMINHTDIWLCNRNMYQKYLSQTNCYHYFMDGYVSNALLPALDLAIPPDVNLITCMKNTEYYLIINHHCKEFFLATHYELFALLVDMRKRWYIVQIHPYTGIKQLGMLIDCTFNYAYLNDFIQEFPLY